MIGFGSQVSGESLWRQRLWFSDVVVEVSGEEIPLTLLTIGVFNLGKKIGRIDVISQELQAETWNERLGA